MFETGSRWSGADSAEGCQVRLAITCEEPTLESFVVAHKKKQMVTRRRQLPCCGRGGDHNFARSYRVQAMKAGPRARQAVFISKRKFTRRRRPGNAPRPPKFSTRKSRLPTLEAIFQNSAIVFPSANATTAKKC